MEMSNNYIIETLLLISIVLFVCGFISAYTSLIQTFINIKQIRIALIIPSLLCIISLNISLIYLVYNFPYAWALNKFYIIGLPTSFCALFFSRDYIFKSLDEINSKEKLISKLYDLTAYFLGGSLISYIIMMSRIKG